MTVQKPQAIQPTGQICGTIRWDKFGDAQTGQAPDFFLKEFRVNGSCRSYQKTLEGTLVETPEGYEYRYQVTGLPCDQALSVVSIEGIEGSTPQEGSRYFRILSKPDPARRTQRLQIGCQILPGGRHVQYRFLETLNPAGQGVLAGINFDVKGKKQ